MEIKDVLSYLGLKEDIKDMDSFKDAVSKEYIKRSIAEKDDEIVGKITGRFAGQALTAVKRMAKSAGVSIEKDVLENKKLEDIIDFVGENLGKSIDAIKTDYEGKLKATETDAVKDWKEKFEKLESKFKDTSGMVKTMQDQLSQKDNEYKGKIKEYKIGDAHKSAIGSIKFANTVDELKRIGFEAKLKEKYELDLDEQESVFPKDKKTGQRIPNPAKNGEFLNWSDVVAKEAEENNLTVKNNAGSGNNTIFGGNGGNAGSGQQSFQVIDKNQVKDSRAIPASQRK